MFSGTNSVVSALLIFKCTLSLFAQKYMLINTIMKPKQHIETETTLQQFYKAGYKPK